MRAVRSARFLRAVRATPFMRTTSAMQVGPVSHCTVTTPVTFSPVRHCSAPTASSGPRSRATARSLAPDSVTPEDEEVTFRIMYGSQTGTAQEFAMLLADALDDAELTASVEDLFEWKESTLPEAGNVVLMMACFGQGQPTDSAVKFYEWLMEQTADSRDWSALRFSVFGLGSSKTHTEFYNVIGRRIDQKLEQLGSQRMFKRGEGDDSKVIEADFENWQQEFVTAMVRLSNGEAPLEEAAPVKLPSSTEKRVVPLITHSSPPDTVHRHEHARRVPDAQRLQVVESECMTPKMPQPTWELLLKSAEGDSPLAYGTGDHVMVYPSNTVEKVAALCTAAGWDAEQVIEISSKHPLAVKGAAPANTPMTVGAMLGHYLDIACIPPLSLVRTLASTCTDSGEAQQLKHLSEPDSYTRIVKNNWLQLTDILNESPSSSLPLDVAAVCLPALQPRSYSVSSPWEPEGEKGELRVTYRHVQVKTALGVARQGTCTTWMRHLGEGAKVSVKIRPSDFKLPEDPSVPVIFISGGVGIAPFRAFMQQRLHQGAKGPAMLFHGCYGPDDMVYQPLIDSCLEAGALSSCITAYSGPPHGGRMISDEVLANGKQVWELLESGCVVYLCGGATGFGMAAAQAFRRVASEHGGLSPIEADIWFSETLLSAGRYLEDLSD